MPMTDPELKQYYLCSQRLFDYSSYRQSYDDMGARMYEQWRCRILDEDGDWPARSMVFFPKAFQVVEHTAMRMSILMPKWRVIGSNPSMDQLSHGIDMALRWHWMRNMMGYKMMHLSKYASIYGTALAFVPWRRRTRTTRKYLPIYLGNQGFVADPEKPNELIRRLVKDEHVTFEGPTCEPIHFGDFWTAPLTSCLRSEPDLGGRIGTDCIHRAYVTLDELKNSGIYQHVDEIGENDYSFRSDNYDLNAMQRVLGINTEIYNREKGIVMLHYYWDTDPPRVTIIANGATLIYYSIIHGDKKDPIENYPFADGELPFIHYQDIVVPGQFYGYPRIWTVEGLQEYINVWGNLMMQQLDYTVNPLLLYDKNAFGVNDLSWEPGQAIGINGRSMAIRDLAHWSQPAPLNPEHARMHAYAGEMYDDATGISKQVRGGIGGSELATEIATAAANSNFIFRSMIMNMESTFMTPMLYAWLWRMRQFQTEEQTISMLGQLGVNFKQIPVSPEALNLNWMIRIDPESSTSGAPEQRRARAMEMLSLFANPQSPFAARAKVGPILEYIMQEGFEQDFPEKFVKTDAEIEQEMAQETAIERAVAQQYQMNPGMMGGPNAGQSNPFAPQSTPPSPQSGPREIRTPQGSPGMQGLPRLPPTPGIS